METFCGRQGIALQGFSTLGRKRNTVNKTMTPTDPRLHIREALKLAEHFINSEVTETECLISQTEALESIQESLTLFDALIAEQKPVDEDSILALIKDLYAHKVSIAFAMSALRPYLHERPAVSLEEWQPMETAPKDGTEVLLISQMGPKLKDYAVAYFEDGEWFWNKPKRFLMPTAWMPLPDRQYTDDTQGGK